MNFYGDTNSQLPDNPSRNNLLIQSQSGESLQVIVKGKDKAMIQSHNELRRINSLESCDEDNKKHDEKSDKVTIAPVSLKQSQMEVVVEDQFEKTIEQKVERLYEQPAKKPVEKSVNKPEEKLDKKPDKRMISKSVMKPAEKEVQMTQVSQILKQSNQIEPAKPTQNQTTEKFIAQSLSVTSLQEVKSPMKSNLNVYSIKKEEEQQIIDWITAELNEEELKEAKERVKNSNSLSDIPLGNLFPYITLCISLCRGKQKIDKSTPIKKMKSSIERQMKSHMPKILAEIVEDDDLNLQQIISDYGETYKGTHPVSDAKIIYNQQANMKNKKLTETELIENLKNSIKKFSFFMNQNINDPFESFGYGIMSYFSLLRYLMLLFFTISIMMIPIYIIYYNGGQFDGHEKTSSAIKLHRFSIGNLGQTSTECFFQHSTLDLKRTLSCSKGKISPLVHVGFNPRLDKKLESLSHCGDYKAIPEIQKCTEAMMDLEEIKTHFQTECAGKKSCNFNMVQYLKSSECQNENSQVYGQFICDFEEEMKRQQLSGLAVGFFTCLAGLLFVSCIEWLSIKSNYEYQLWDANNVTSADFTVKLTITEQQWAKWMQVKKENQSFKDYLEKEIIEQTSKFPPVFKGTSALEPIEVAFIGLGYDNDEVIQLLLKRGQLISKGKFDKLSQIASEIVDQISNNEKKFQRVVAAFVTFTTQEARQRFIKHFETKRDFFYRSIQQGTDAFKFLKEETEVIEAVESSNIIWENLSVTGVDLFKNWGSVSAFILLFLFIVLGGLSWFKYYILNKYGSSGQHVCENIQDLYTSHDQFREYAVKESIVYSKYPQQSKTYFCYCTSHKAEDAELCSKITNNESTSQDYLFLLSISIALMNTGITQVMLVVNRYIKFDYEDQILRSIYSSILISQFFNTAIILLLTNANFEDFKILSILPYRGNNKDFTTQWHLEAGPLIVQTMIVMAFSPYYTFVLGYLQKFILRLLDSGFDHLKNKDFKSKKTTIQQFVNLYSGPDMPIHYRYSQILNIVFVTFTYGIALPILFPIAFLCMLNTYIAERIQLAYYFKQPPLYDDRLSRRALQQIQFAPALMMMMGYWFLSNQQMFFNKIQPKQFDSEVVDPMHSYFEGGYHITPIFIAMFVFIFQNQLGRGVKYAIGKLTFIVTYEESIAKLEEKCVVNERLDEYWKCLNGLDQKRWFAKETHLRKALNMKTINDKSYQKLKNSKRGSKYIINLINYDILQNWSYADKFYYTQMDRRVENASSDFVASLIYYGEDRCNIEQNKFQNLKTFFDTLMEREKQQITKKEVNEGLLRVYRRSKINTAMMSKITVKAKDNMFKKAIQMVRDESLECSLEEDEEK